MTGLVGFANPDPEAAAGGAFITNFPDSALFLGSLILVIFLYTVSTRGEEREREESRGRNERR